MSVTGDWELCSTASAKDNLLSFLEVKGLGTYAQKIIEETDAESVDDLRLIDAAMLEQVIQAIGLKMVSAKKLRLALAELRGEAPPEAGSAAELVVGAASAGPGDSLPDSANAVHVASVTPAVPVETQEYIVVCIDRSGSMGSPFNEVTLNVVKGETKNSVSQRTRMEAVKAMFYAFRDRADQVGQGTYQMGLVQFDDRIERLLDLTPRLDRFEALVDDMEKRGSTAIYSSIVEAATMLQKHFDTAMKADFRVLVLTDGQNNAGVAPADAVEAAGRVGAVVDAIIVGNSPDSSLRKIVAATGGECWQINDFTEGFELLEAEGVVSLKARRGGAEKPPFKPLGRVDFASVTEKAVTKPAEVKRVCGLSEDLAKKTVVSVHNLQEGSLNAGGSSHKSTKRLLSELKKVADGTEGGEGVHVFPAGDSLGFWRALIEGPAGTPFEGGTFVLNVVIPDEYPLRPPKITFETPVYHCNVSDSGTICLDILLNQWSPALTIPRCLQSIRVLLEQPDRDNALRQWIAELAREYEVTKGVDSRYYDEARAATSRDASVTVSEWRQRWGC